MTATAQSTHAHPAAWVDGEPVDPAIVEAELTRLRNGPRAAVLPHAASSEGRQLRRWVAQTVVARRLLENEADRRGLRDEPAPGTDDVLPSRAAAMGLGGVLASVLRRSGPARAVYVAVTADVEVSDEEVRAYVARSGASRSGDAEEAARAALTEARRREAFLDWHSLQAVARVRLEHGFEHPGDPGQPDATHRH